MADSELNLLYHGLLLPKITHSEESLEYLQKLTLKDDDVIAVTYPKSGKIAHFWGFSSKRAERNIGAITVTSQYAGFAKVASFRKIRDSLTTPG